MPRPEPDQRLKLELDRCVKCGLCLPECPTYRLRTNENESPRGRIALIEGLVGGRLSADAPLMRHLDSCLACRRCERVCPSKVRYGRLIDTVRARTPHQVPFPLRWLDRPGVMRLGTRLARLLPLGLSRPFGALQRMHRLARALPIRGAAPAPGDYPPLGEARRGRIALFVGCAGSAQQPGTLGAALTLLRRVGFTVSIVTEPGCCGALAQHAGDTRRAAQLAERNRRALDGGFDAIVSVASGCGIHLDDYAPALPAPHYDINRFLIEQGRLSADDFRPSNRSVALHTPCSVQNVYRGEKWARELLALIPQLRVEALGEAGQCCGAAGDYMLRHPHTAQQLRKPLLAQFVALGSESLLTSNIGCAMHLADGLRENPLPVHVLHPVELLAEQLK